jgi:dihydropteroate synthase
MPKINLSHVQLMGILNLTPDSFSDGGQIQNPQDFLQKAEKLLIEGATILDLGAEASGPNSIDISAETELNRLKPYLAELQKLKTNHRFRISIDTYKSSVAGYCLQNGANIINDITALRQDPQLAQVVAKHNCPVILMYSKDNTPRTTKTATTYKDIIETLIEFFEERISYAESQGISRSNIILDPGMGAFVSTIADYSYEILERLQELKQHFNLPILVGTSKKSMHNFPLEERLIPSIITATLGAVNGADFLRVHNVKEHKQALQTLSF